MSGGISCRGIIKGVLKSKTTDQTLHGRVNDEASDDYIMGYANTDGVICHTIKSIGKTAFAMGRGVGGAPPDFSPCEAEGRGGSASWIRLVHCMEKPL
jgi:hypothetical protein